MGRCPALHYLIFTTQQINLDALLLCQQLIDGLGQAGQRLEPHVAGQRLEPHVAGGDTYQYLSLKSKLADYYYEVSC